MNKFFTVSLFLFASLLANAQSKMAHLNSQEVMAAMPSYNKAVTDLNSFQAELQDELEAMVADYREAMQIYLEKRPDLTPIRVQFEEEKLAKKERDINERQQAVQSEVEAYSRELNLPILTKLETAVKTVSDRGGYDYVFDISVVMISNGPDITKEVITEVLKIDNAIMPPPQEVIMEEEVRP